MPARSICRRGLIRRRGSIGAGRAISTWGFGGAASRMRGVWTSYSARHAAQLIGLPESAVRSCIRDRLVGMPGTVPAQLTFRDLSALRTVKALIDAGLPLPRVRRELARIQLALPDGTSLAELTIEARGGEVHVRGHGGVAPVGQLALPFGLGLAELGGPEPEAGPGPGAEIHELLPRPSEGPA